MKQKKRLLAMIICSVLAVSTIFAACGEDRTAASLSEEEIREAERQILASNEEIMAAKSIEGNMYLDYSMEVLGESIEVSLDVDFIEEGETQPASVSPDKMYLSGTVSSNGTKVETEIYSLSNGDGTQTVYSCTGDPASPEDWTIETQTEEAVSDGQMELVNGMLGSDRFYIEAMSKDEVNGKPAVKVLGEVDAEKYIGLLAENLGIEVEYVEGARALYTVWMDEQNGKIVQYEIDLAQTIKPAIEAMLKAEGRGKDDLKMKEMRIGMRIDELDGAIDLTLPDALQEKIDHEQESKVISGIMSQYLLGQY